MKSLSMALFVLVAAGLAGQAAARPGLAKSKNCMGSHAVEPNNVTDDEAKKLASWVLSL